MRFCLSLLLLFLLASPAWAWQLSGTVTDGQGEPLPYANVYVENSTYGVVTNLKGQYFLELKDGTYNISFSLLGFTRQVVTVTVKGRSQTLDVKLVEEDLEMGAVEIVESRRDPAYAIMDSVVAHKWEYIRQYETYACDIYLKASLESDTLKKDKDLSPEDSLKMVRKDSAEKAKAAEREAEKEAKLAEKEARQGQDSAAVEGDKDSFKEDAYGDMPRPKLNFIEYFATICHANPDRDKTIIHAWRDFTQKNTGSVQVNFGDAESRSGSPSGQASNPYLFYLDVADADFNFYRNLIEIPDLSVRPFVSPASSSGALYYRYRLVQSFMEDGRLVHEIEVTPRNIAAPLFSGTLFVMEKSWAIKSVNLRLNPDAIYYFKYFQIIQDHSRHPEDGRWVMDREEFFYNTKEGRVRFYGNTVVKYDNYALDTVFGRNYFHNEVRRMDDDALEKDSLYWASSRPLALKPEEERFIRTQDSINDILTSAKYMAEQDSAFNRLSIWDFLLNGVGFRNSFKKTTVFFLPLVAQIRPLGVGGYRHAIGGTVEKEWDRAHGIDLNYELDFGVVNQDLKGYGRLAYIYAPKHFGRVYVKGGNIFSMVNTNPSITAAFSRGNYVQKLYGGVGHRIEIVNGVQLDVSAEWADRRSLENLDLEEWSNTLFGGLNEPVKFDPYKEFLLKASVEFTPFQKYAIEPYKKVNLGSAWPTFTFNYRKAIPNIYGSAIDYDFAEVVASHKIKIGTVGESRWRFNAGTYLTSDSVQFTDYKFFRGSDKFYFSDPLQSFQLLGPTLSTKNPFLMANYLHNFNGMFLNKVPYIRRLKMEEIVGAGTLLIPDQSFEHVEVFAGVTLPFRIKRQMFKVGAYFVTSYSNVAELQASIKFGINFFDSQANSWVY